MARFRATIQGNRGEASRLGSAASGITATVNGWNIGARVEVQVGSTGVDEVRVYLTDGSSRAYGDGVCLGVFERRAGGGALVQVGAFTDTERARLEALVFPERVAVVKELLT